MDVAQTIEQIRRFVAAARRSGCRVGFVPTMGALHGGHVRLIETARKNCDYVVVSIFVNPTQFGPCEDFERYPRDIDADIGICREAGVDAVFAPTVGQMYPQPGIVCVDVEKPAENLCGRFRPGHFRGVATVCAKLFNIVGPDKAFFGQKDAQQVIIVRRMVQELDMPVEIVVCPTVRQADGLAMSSRNKYLSARQGREAVLLYKALCRCKDIAMGGSTDCKVLADEMKKILSEGADIKVEYATIVDINSLEDIEKISDRALAAIAVKLGTTRLIDNIVIDLNNSDDNITI